VRLPQVYAAAFFVIPGVRLALSRRTNARIAARNATRAQQARALAAPSPALRLKLDSGRGKARRQVRERERERESLLKPFKP
jgi:hypothetical protein